MKAIANSAATQLVAATVAAVMVLSSFAAFAGQVHAATDVEELCALAAALGISSPEFNALCGGDSSDEEESMMTAGETYYVHHPSIDFDFTRNLYLGSRGNDVMMLQKVLNSDSATQVAASGVGSAGNETEYFGPATKRAVAAFQAKNGISPAAGYFYPLTRTEMNRTTVSKTTGGGSTSSSTSTTASGDELVVREGDNPRSELMPEGVVRFPITAFELVAGDEDVDVEQVTVRYNGNARHSQIIDSVVILDEDMNIVGGDENLNSDEEADLDIQMTIEEGESVMFYVAVNAASDTSGDFERNDGLDFTMDVVDVESDADDVDGLPVSGADMEIQDNIELGTVDVDLSSSGTTSIEVGEEEELFAKIEIDSNAEEDDSVFVKSFRLENTGTGDLDDLENIYVEVDNDEYEGTIDSNDDDFIVFDFGSGFELEDGDSENFEVRADTGTAAGDNYQFIIDELSDFYVESEAGYGMPITAANDNLTGPVITIGTGQVSLDNGEDEETEKITVGNDIVIGLFNMEVEGEAFVADRLTLTIGVADGAVVSGGTLTGTQSDLNLNDVYIADANGNALTDKEDAKGTGSATYNQTVEFDDVEFPVGDHENLQIVADIDDEVGSGTKYTIADLDYALFNDVEGKDSGDAIADTEFSGKAEFRARTVEAAALAVTVDTGEPSEVNVSKDSDQVETAVVELDARDSGEDVLVSEFTLTFGTPDTPSDTITDEDEVDNCRLYDESGNEVDITDNVDIRSGTTTYEFQFKDAFTVEADSKVELSVRCDVGNINNNETFTWSINNTDADIDAEGATTGNDNFATVTDNSAKTMVMVAAEATVAQDSDTPDAQIVKLGADDVVLGIIEVEAEDGDVTVDDIAFTLDNYNLLDGNDQINVYVGDERIDSVDLNDADGAIENLDIDVNKDQKVNITFKADIESSDTLDGGVVTLSVTSVVLEDSGTVTGGAQTFKSVTAYEAVPELEIVSKTTNTLENVSEIDYELFEFSVKADGADMFVNHVDLNVKTFSNIDSTTGELYVYENASHTNEYGTDSHATATITSAGIKTFTFPNNIQIDDGQTYYFVLKADITSTVDPATITIEMEEDVDGVSFAADAGSSAETINSQDVMEKDFAATHSYTN